MAKKRAQIDAVLTVASLSEIFTQDFDDLPSETQPTVQPVVNKIKQDTQAAKDFYCDNCGAGITEKVANYSTEKFGRTLCMACQKTINS